MTHLVQVELGRRVVQLHTGRVRVDRPFKHLGNTQQSEAGFTVGAPRPRVCVCMEGGTARCTSRPTWRHFGLDRSSTRKEPVSQAQKN